jgi:hypothetical protein
MKKKEKKEKDGKYLSDLKKYILKAENRVKYSIERFDILIITLSSGGLVLGISLYSNFKEADKFLVGLSWMFFSTALIINLLSQISGYFANKLDIKCVNNIIDEIEKREVSGNPKLLETIHKICNKGTDILNLLSFICLVIGIIQTIIFVNCNI